MKVTPFGPPEDPSLLKYLFSDPLGIESFLEKEYLNSYIKDGGSKVKFLISAEGAGKTTLIRRLEIAATEMGFLTSYCSAKDHPLYRFDDLYRAILAPVDVMSVVKMYCKSVITALGYQPESIPPGMTFAQYCISKGRVPEVVRRDIREQLEHDLLRGHHDIEPAFASCVMQLAACVLGAMQIAPEDMLVLQRWLKGESLTIKDRNRLHLYTPIDRYTARFILYSFASFVRDVGYSGLFVGIDDLDVIVGEDPACSTRYTRSKRDDFYESIRELIDHVDMLSGFFCLLAGPRSLITNPTTGFRSYPALWLRLQNNIESELFNKFLDIIDLDAAWEADNGALRGVGLRHARILNVAITGHEEIDSVAARRGGTSPVRRVVAYVLERAKKE